MSKEGGDVDPAGAGRYYYSSMIKRGKLLLIAAVILGVELMLNTSELIPSVYVTPLPGGCDISYFDTTTRPVFTIVLSCPRKDMIRLWPWPIEYPWFAEPYKPGESDRAFYLLSYLLA